jgi:hypothetical protein
MVVSFPLLARLATVAASISTIPANVAAILTNIGFSFALIIA